MLGKLQRDVAREIAVLWILRPLDVNLNGHARRERARYGPAKAEQQVSSGVIHGDATARPSLRWARDPTSRLDWSGSVEGRKG